MALSLLQLRRIEKLLEKGEEGLLEYLLEVEEKVSDLESGVVKVEVEGDKPTYKEIGLSREEVTRLVERIIDRDYSPRSYQLTESDKKDIASKIDVPVVEKKVEKVIERIETPIYNTEVKEVAVADSADDIRNKLELLTGDERLDKKSIKGLEEYEDMVKSVREAATRVISNSRNLYQLLDVNVEGITTNQSIKWNGTQWVPYTASGGTGYTVETPSGSVNSSNVTFTVTTIPVYIVSDGITYFENAGYTRSSLTLTLDVPPSSYIRSFY